MEELRPIVARRIAALRQSSGMTQMELAEALHYSDKAVSKWERGESLPDVTVLKQIADLFHVTVDSLLSDDQPQPAPAVRHNRQRIFQLVTAISQLGIVSVTLVMFIIFRHWLVCTWAVTLACVVWLVLNSLWFSRRRNYLIISCLMWSLLLNLCLTLWQFAAPVWELLAVGLPGEGIIWLCSRFSSKAQKGEKA